MLWAGGGDSIFDAALVHMHMHVGSFGGWGLRPFNWDTNLSLRGELSPWL